MSRRRTKLFLQNILNPKVARITDTVEADGYQKIIIASLSSSKCLVFMQVLAFITFKVIIIVVIYIILRSEFRVAMKMKYSSCITYISNTNSNSNNFVFKETFTSNLY